VNAIAGLSLNLLGGNIDLWRAKHNQIHHTYSNVDEWDDDIDIRPWMRMTHTQPRRPWVTLFDIEKQLRRRIGLVALPRPTARQRAGFWGWKALNFATLVVRTTANFAVKNRLVTWYCGGLNFQLEHHLLPRVSHIRYPRLKSARARGPFYKKTSCLFTFARLPCLM
jgi:fatty acid desaturase